MSNYRSKRTLAGRCVNSNNFSIPLRFPFCAFTSKSAKICLLNARSICNKATIINNFVCGSEIDLLCLCETWLTPVSNLNIIINELKPKGYNFKHVSRSSRGGGVGFLFKTLK